MRRDGRGVQGLAVETSQGDLLDPGSLDRAFCGAQVVYHAAAHVSIASGDEALVRETNVVGTRHVVDACLRAGVQRLVHFSSIHALSAQPSGETIDESRPLANGRGVLPYDRSKADAEREVRSGIERGLDAVVVIPTAVLGPLDFRPSAMGRVALDLALGRLPVLVDGAFDWVDVRDVVHGSIRAAERGSKGDRFLLAGHRRTLRQLADAVQAVTGRRAPWLVLPMWLAQASAPFAAAWANVMGRSPRLTRASLQALRNHQWVSHALATRRLDYHPRPFEETIEATLAWFRSSGALG